MPKITKGTKVTAEGKTVKVYKIRYLDKSKRGKNGKPMHRQETFLRQKDAESRLLVINNELHEGTHIARGGAMTIEAVAEMFLREAEDKLRDGRIGRYRMRNLKDAIDRTLVPMAGARKLNEMSALDVENLYRDMIRVGGLAPMTAKGRLGILAQIQGFAIKRNLLKTTPVTEALKELRGVRRAKVRTFTADQVTLLLRTASQRRPGAHHRSHLYLNLFVNIAAFCGLRWGEIAGLTLPCIDLDRRVIAVRHNLTVWGELKGPKTHAGLRDVPMPNHVAALLREWMAAHYVENERRLLFTGTIKGGTAQPQCFHVNHWGPLLERAGLLSEDRFHFHALRHFAASWMIDNGMSVVDVAQILGHSTFDMTLQTYAHPIVNGDRRHALFERVSGHLIGAPVVLDAVA